jgi:hypothetical protein
MSEPTGTLAGALLKANVTELICITQDDVHVRSTAHETISGRDTLSAPSCEIDIPHIRSKLQMAYPLVDRWVSRSSSISSTLELMLEYTVDLINVIRSHPPDLALLETGSPHHLFSYCLDVALRYLRIPHYYLYGNAFDGRCIIFCGNEKQENVSSSCYSAETSVDHFIAQVRQQSNYTPEDSTKSLAPTLHRSLPFALCLKFRHLMSHFVRSLTNSSNHPSRNIALQLPRVGFFDTVRIFQSHHAYQQLIGASKSFDPSEVQSSDIVYVGHMLPESTSFPESPHYPGEADVLMDLRARFPGTRLFYREHPAISLYSENGHIHLQGLHKSPEFYRQLQRLGVTIIPHTLHISGIRNRGCLFVTKTGRVAVENSVLGIPTVIYGYPFYGRDLPTAMHITDLPARMSVENIKSLATSGATADAVRAHLIALFSGSIANPGIGLGSNAKARPEHEADLVRLVSQLAEKRQKPGSKED